MHPRGELVRAARNLRAQAFDAAASFLIEGRPPPSGPFDRRLLTAPLVDVGYIDNPGSVVVDVYGADGALLGSIPVDRYGIVHVTSNFAGANSFTVLGALYEPAGFAIDNVEFPTPTAVSQPPLRYVAMGDSFFSGESNPPYQKSSSIEPYNSKSDGCDRSDAAYPQVLAADLSVNNINPPDVQFIACSGEAAANMVDTSNTFDKEKAQTLQSQQIVAHWGQDPDLVTWTAGGNDAGFIDILQHCVQQWRFNYWPHSCADDATWVAQYTRQITSLEPELQKDYAQMAASFGPNTSVLVADYPQIFPADPAAQDCIQLSEWLSEDDIDLFREWTDDLDLEIHQAAHADGLNFVEVRDNTEFAGHSVCDSGGADFNAVTNNDAGSILQGLNIFRKVNYKGAFHPNQFGQQAYAYSFENYINDAAGGALNAAGLPLAPGTPGTPGGGGGGGVDANIAANAALAASPAGQPVDTTNADTTAGAGALTISTQLPQDDSCDQTYQGGQTVTVSGGGFAPGARVTITLQPDTTEALTQTVTADDTGNIAWTQRLPLDLAGSPIDAGFLPAGYIEANGAGATTTTQMDNLMFNVAPHGSSCGPIDTLPFDGFNPPVSNAPTVNAENPGRTIPVKLELRGVPGTLADATWLGFPQSTPVSCSSLTPTGPAAPTSATAAGSQSGSSDHYNYLWSTDPSWTGCRELDIRLADGSDHIAYFNFGDTG